MGAVHAISTTTDGHQLVVKADGHGTAAWIDRVEDGLHDQHQLAIDTAETNDRMGFLVGGDMVSTYTLAGGSDTRDVATDRQPNETDGHDFIHRHCDRLRAAAALEEPIP